MCVCVCVNEVLLQVFAGFHDYVQCVAGTKCSCDGSRKLNRAFMRHQLSLLAFVATPHGLSEKRRIVGRKVKSAVVTEPVEGGNRE